MGWLAIKIIFFVLINLSLIKKSGIRVLDFLISYHGMSCLVVFWFCFIIEGDKGFNLKQEDFQLVVANSVQLPLVEVMLPYS